MAFDRLSALLDRFAVQVELSHSGPLCGLQTFPADGGVGYLHVLRRGPLSVTHPRGYGLPSEIHITEPSLLFYPRPVTHRFHNPPQEGSDFTCATVDFQGGQTNPLVNALPPLIHLPLSAVNGLEAALKLLFAETDQVRCGHRLLANRLFEIVLIQLLRWLLDHPEQAGIPPGLFTGLSHPRLAPLLVALHEHPGKPWRLESMAETAGLSRTTFASTFRDVMGQTPGDYLADWRMTIVQSRLQKGEAVGVIANAMGYASASALARAFAARMGCSPREWLSHARLPK
ncbi:MAG: AraC family transcriptional regulator [Hahellaceae bacterium]|jgi:AraC-like DNA-binding protein|nr:AraC family transcriptional regulator [Hahellaceae bacterium]